MGSVHMPEGLELDLEDVLAGQVDSALESPDDSVRRLGKGMLAGSVLLKPNPHVDDDGRLHTATAEIQPEDVPEAMAEAQRIAGQELNAQLGDVPLH